MNKKTLKLFLAAALSLSLLCAAQTVNAMESESVSVSTIDDSKLNNSNVDEKSKIIKILTTAFENAIWDYNNIRNLERRSSNMFDPEYGQYNDSINSYLSIIKRRIFSNYYLNKISNENVQKIKEITNRFLANLWDYENFSYEDNFNSMFEEFKKNNPNLSIEEFRKQHFVIFGNTWFITRAQMVLIKIAKELGIEPEELGIHKLSLTIYKKLFENPEDIALKTINDYMKSSLLKAYKNIIQNHKKITSDHNEFMNDLKQRIKPFALLKNKQPKSAKKNETEYNIFKKEIIYSELLSLSSEIKDEIKNNKLWTEEAYIDKINKLFMNIAKKLEIKLDEQDFKIAQNDLTKEKTNSLNQVSAQPSSNNLIADKTEALKEADPNLNDMNKKDVSNQVSVEPSSNNLVADKTQSSKKAELKEEKVNVSNQVSAQPSNNNLIAEQKPINSQVDFKISDDQILEIIREFEKTFVYSRWSKINIKNVVKCLINSILHKLMNYLKIDDIDKLTNTNFTTTQKTICSFVLNSNENTNKTIKDAFSENEFTKFRCRILAKCFEAIENIYNRQILNNNQIKSLKKMANI